MMASGSPVSLHLDWQTPTVASFGSPSSWWQPSQSQSFYTFYTSLNHQEVGHTPFVCLVLISLQNFKSDFKPAIANSAGPDSTCLLYLLSLVAKEKSIQAPKTVFSVHVHHGLQADDRCLKHL